MGSFAYKPGSSTRVGASGPSGGIYTGGVGAVSPYGGGGAGSSYTYLGNVGVGGIAPPSAMSYGGGFGGGPSLGFNTQRDPQIEALQGEMAGYQRSLAAGNDADAQLAMQRQRDLASGMAKEGLQGAQDRGFSADTGYAQQRRLQGLDASAQAQAALNTNLTSDARRQQLAALQGRGQLATAQAGILQGQQNYLLNQWQAQQDAARAQAQFQAAQQQNAFQNQMALANQARSMYTGFGGGGGGGYQEGVSYY